MGENPKPRDWRWWLKNNYGKHVNAEVMALVDERDSLRAERDQARSDAEEYRNEARRYLQTAAALESERDQARAEAESLRQRLTDYEDDRRRVLSGECALDERHCACVPDLRAEAERLRADRDYCSKELDAAVMRCDSLKAEVERLKRERDESCDGCSFQISVIAAKSERDAALASLECVGEARDAYQRERDAALKRAEEAESTAAYAMQQRDEGLRAAGLAYRNAVMASESRATAAEAEAKLSREERGEALRRMEAAEAENARLREEARRYYRADGSFEVLEPEEVVRRRKEAAVILARAVATESENARLRGALEYVAHHLKHGGIYGPWRDDAKQRIAAALAGGEGERKRYPCGGTTCEMRGSGVPNGGDCKTCKDRGGPGRREPTP